MVFRKEITRQYSKLDQKQESDLKQINKDLLLQNSLRQNHCRPMIKMFKAFNSYEMMVDIEPGFNEHQFTDNVKGILN